MAESRSQRLARETVEFSLKGPVCVTINEEQLSNEIEVLIFFTAVRYRTCNSGCAILDLNFSAPSQIGEVSFRNYYTMWIAVLVKSKIPLADATGTNIGSLPATRDENISDWVLSVPKKVLMPHPHHETGSHDLVSICCSESSVEWKDIVAMRLILKQPSPVWRTFHVEEINVFGDLPRRAPGKETDAESLLTLIRKQTIAALKWKPTTEGQGQTGAYEFTSLPVLQ